MRMDSRNNLFSATIIHYCVRCTQSRFDQYDTQMKLHAMAHKQKKDEFWREIAS